MKNEQTITCPGCKRHCPMNNARCKYGRQYFAKLEAAEENKHEEKKYKPRHKWERNIQRGGLAWQLLMVSRSAKDALKEKKMTEEQLLNRLTAADRESLAALLAKLDHSNIIAQAGEM